MKKTIAEDLPARNHPSASMSAEKGEHDEKKGKTPEDRVRQAVYDIRYRARREEITLPQAYSQYMQNSSMSQQEKVMVKRKLFVKVKRNLFAKGGIIRAEDFNIQDFATNNVANALYKVFVEKVQYEEPITLTYMEKLETAESRKYKVRVTGKDGRSYVRYATRDKISQLRANPNIESVEMTEYGEPYEGEKERGEYTAKAKAGKDWDGDGKVESGPKEYRGVVHNAIQRKKGGTPDGKDTSNVREDFIGEKNTTTNQIDKPIEVMKGFNKVTIAPDVPGSGRNEIGRLQMAHYDMGSVAISESQAKLAVMIREKAESEQQQKLFGLALSVKRGQTPRSEVSAEVLKIVDTMSEKKIRDFAKTKHEGIPVHKEEMDCEDDERSLPTKRNLIKNKLRAMGMKNPLIMVAGYEPEGEVIDERTRERKGQPRPKRDLAMEIIRSMPNVKQGLMTRSGRTVTQHEAERGVSKRDLPQRPEQTTADRLAARKQREAAAKAYAERAKREEERRRRLG